ncbi:hypothetical protein EK904_003531, partial [Melospiza melodia maxima]
AYEDVEKRFPVDNSVRVEPSASTGRWLHSAPLLVWGAKKEKLLPPLPFCWQHGWLKAAEQVRFIVSPAIVIQAKMAAAVWRRADSNHAVPAERLLPPLAPAVWLPLWLLVVPGWCPRQQGPNGQLGKGPKCKYESGCLDPHKAKSKITEEKRKQILNPT